MERPITKISLLFLLLSSIVWLYAASMKNYHTGTLLKFGTIELKENISPIVEREVYDSIARHSAIVFFAYPLTLLFGSLYLKTTSRTFKKDGWLMMSVILFFMFVPVELYCFWLDWKLVGLHYWGNWELVEFRKAFLARTTALAGLPLIAQLCYYTIPFLLIFKPLSSKVQK